jgi:cytidine deaminase
MTNEELLIYSRKARENAYAPYSGYAVGAAVLCADGRVYAGCNVENASYGAAVCAEQTALCKAVSEGSRDFVKIAVTGSGTAPAYPCGICRQMLSELAPDITVVVETERGICEYTLLELLPHGFQLIEREI